ncbi:hypothetical protein CK203_072652 [Vitis vinifera]|uniref:Protein MAK16-like n=1 Tax=Vitis vinifera TaxID=29760 RepID=A0A438EYY9_VITVI|nr:hypothetical protein CK203_072652 [Vitis vinifera]
MSRNAGEKIMTTPRKEKKREARREEKAEKAAVLDKSIEKELLERLKRGVYGDIYNYPVKEYNKVLDMEGLQAASEDEEEEEPEIEYVEGYEELEEEDDIEDFGGLEIDESLKDEDLACPMIGEYLKFNPLLPMNTLDDDMGEDDDEMDLIDRKRVRRGSGSSHGKLDKDERGANLKKRPRVLVEVEHEGTDERQKAIQ